MKYADAMHLLTQEHMVCMICFMAGKRSNTHPECLIGGSAVLGSRTSIFDYDRQHGAGAYHRATARRLEKHLLEQHADHPLTRKYVSVLPSR